MRGDLARVFVDERFGSFELTPTGLVISGAPSLAEWQACGARLRQVEGAIQFWIGDWVNYGHKAYGDKYVEAVDATGFDQRTIETYSYVAQNITITLRSVNLPFSVHREIAPLPREKQVEIIRRAESGGSDRPRSQRVDPRWCTCQ